VSREEGVFCVELGSVDGGLRADWRGIYGPHRSRRLAKLPTWLWLLYSCWPNHLLSALFRSSRFCLSSAPLCALAPCSSLGLAILATAMSQGCRAPCTSLKKPVADRAYVQTLLSSSSGFAVSTTTRATSSAPSTIGRDLTMFEISGSTVAKSTPATGVGARVRCGGWVETAAARVSLKAELRPRQPARIRSSRALAQEKSDKKCTKSDRKKACGKEYRDCGKGHALRECSGAGFDHSYENAPHVTLASGGRR
jgi:hypothetical protein